MSKPALLATLREQRLLAIVRGSARSAVVASGLTLLECGITCLEVSLTSDDAFGAIGELAAKAGSDAAIGAGTVLAAADVHRAGEAGARFIVTPGLCPAVAEARAAGLPVLTGALTPSEIIAAAAESTAVKLFPAAYGGPAYVRAIRDPLPEVPLIPVGGVDAGSVPAYLAAGALAVGVGSPLLGDAAHGGDLDELRLRANAFRSAARGADMPPSPYGT